MPGYIKIFGRSRKTVKDPWRDIVCFVSFEDASAHRDIVEASFRYHLELDLDYMKKHHPGHFSDPHNVARAILLYRHFRPNHTFFEDSHFGFIGPQHLPTDTPLVEGVGFKLWLSNAP